MEKNLSEQIISRVQLLSVEVIPDFVIHEAKRCLIDYCGVVLAGTRLYKEKEVRFLDIAGNKDTGSTTLFGLDKKADVYTAALINGINAHAVELDDGHRFGMMHMGAPVISAILSVAENRNISGEKILRAIICGYDISIALARHMQPGHKLKGYHATGTCCTVGAAMSIALMLDYKEDQIRGTLSAAATGAAGLLELIDDGSQLKPYNIGRAAMDAVAAAFTGGAGFKGPDDVIGGKRGFFAVLAQTDDYQKIKNLTLFSDGDYAIMEIYTKPYAACRHCHPAIEGALFLRRKMLADSGSDIFNEIDKIIIHTYKLAIAGHDHKKICNVSSAKMSTPYSVAAAVLYGKSGMDAYEQDMLDRNDIGQLMKKTEVILSDELDAKSPGKRSALVEIILKDGRKFSRQIDYPRGEPENRMEDRELEEKAADLILYSGKTSEDANKILAICKNYEDFSNDLYTQLK